MSERTRGDVTWSGCGAAQGGVGCAGKWGPQSLLAKVLGSAATASVLLSQTQFSVSGLSEYSAQRVQGSEFPLSLESLRELHSVFVAVWKV